MYLYIKILKQRLDAINQLRLERASSYISKAFKYVYELLPVLLHYHHPELPGYIEGNVPVGICFFVPNSRQINLLNQFKAYIGHDLFVEQNNGELPITGIYSMGSTSSIGQSNISDLDIWICHQSWLDQEERQFLQKKCILIKQWAFLLRIDVTFFLIDENYFRHPRTRRLYEDSYETTQHILLLDEFYRTAVRMAGKRLLWMIVPVEEEANYDEYILLLYAQGVLTPNEWLDLGGLGKLSAEEYLSASLWHLYKSIHSPYKAILKSILLEAYSWNYPYDMLLSIEFKKYLHAGNIVSYGLDAYCLMLERITRYLVEIDDFKRLDLIRCCFYLKVCEQISDKNNNSEFGSWKSCILSQLITSWKWNKEQLDILNKRNYWKIEQVRDVHNELFDTMMQIYSNLIHFTRHNNLQFITSTQDIGMLARKLYVAFEMLPEK